MIINIQIKSTCDIKKILNPDNELNILHTFETGGVEYVADDIHLFTLSERKMGITIVAKCWDILKTRKISEFDAQHKFDITLDKGAK